MSQVVQPNLNDGRNQGGSEFLNCNIYTNQDGPPLTRELDKQLRGDTCIAQNLCGSKKLQWQ